MPNTDPYIAGQVIHFEGSFTDPDSDDDPINPDIVVFAYQLSTMVAPIQFTYLGSGSPIQLLTKGTFYAELDSTGWVAPADGIVGGWFIWASDDTGKGIGEQTFTIAAPQILPVFS